MRFKFLVCLVLFVPYSCLKDQINMVRNNRNTAMPTEVEIKHEVLQVSKIYYEYTNCFAHCRNQADVDTQLTFSRSNPPAQPPTVDFNKFDVVFITGHGFVGNRAPDTPQVFTYINRSKKAIRLEVRMNSYYESGSTANGFHLWIKIPKVPLGYELITSRKGFECP